MSGLEARTLNLGLHIVDGIARLHLQGDGLAGQGLHEDLHSGYFWVASVRKLFVARLPGGEDERGDLLELKQSLKFGRRVVEAECAEGERE
jgi:hypothetical protein